MSNRKFSAASEYRYGFNNKEKDDNVVLANGSTIAYERRIYDTRTGTWLSTDPLQTKYPSESPYNFVSRNPILYADKDGRDKTILISIFNADGTTTQIRKVDKSYFEYSADSRHGGGYYFYKTSVVQTLTIDNRNPEKISTVQEAMKNPEKFAATYEHVDRTQITAGEYSKAILRKGWEAVFGEGDRSSTTTWGFRIYGNGKDMEWQNKLPNAASESESNDLGKWLEIVGGLREGASPTDLMTSENFSKLKNFLIGVSKQVKSWKKADQSNETSENTGSGGTGGTKINGKPDPVIRTNSGKPGKASDTIKNYRRKTPANTKDPDTLIVH